MSELRSSQQVDSTNYVSMTKKSARQIENVAVTVGNDDNDDADWIELMH